MSSQKEKDVLTNILDMYKDMPFLWSKSHPDYKNKSARNEGYRVLLEMYKNINPDATIKTVTKKIDNMKTAFFREEKKVTASKHTGAGTDDIYVPTLWYYDAFSFLGSTTEPCRSMKESLENENSSSSDEDITQAGSSTVSAKKKKMTLMQKQENLMDSAEKLISMKEDEWEVLGKSIGFQLRELNKRDLTIAHKLISDVIFYAKIGRLTEDSSINLSSSLSLSAPSPFSTSSYHSDYSGHKRFSYISPQYHTQTAQSSPQHHIQVTQPPPQYHTQTAQPSPQHHIQVTQPPPQYHTQTAQSSPQHHIQVSQPSPQYHTQTAQSSPQHHIQVTQPSPQYHTQTAQPSPQHHIQVSQPSPQYHTQTAQPSPQHHIQVPQSSLSMQMPQCNNVQISDTLPQNRVSTPQQPPQYQIQIFDPPVLHIPDSLQNQIQSPTQLDESLESSSQPASTSPRVNIKEYLIFKPNK